MPTSLPQTYLIILGTLLFILAIVVGRQVFKVRRNEINLVKLERDGAINSSDSAKLYELGSAQLNKRLYPQATNSLKQALKQIKDEPEEARAIIENALGFALAAQDNFNEAIKHYKNAIKVLRKNLLHLSIDKTAEIINDAIKQNPPIRLNLFHKNIHYLFLHNLHHIEIHNH